jgi:N-acetylglucosaminyl-diphospho-decaprenol L-rhamnosyltransferase
VVVPSCNKAEMLALLLESLSRQTIEHEVVVVDNGSTDGTRELLATRFPHVSLLALPENIGFGRAINRGVSGTRAETLVFVNNDAVCEPDFLERLCAGLAPTEGIVMTAGVLLKAEDPETIDSAGIMFDRTLLAFDYLHGEPAGRLAVELPGPLGASGGAGAFARSAFDAVGGFDENFFAYLEDVDLAVRLISAGGRCRLAPGARAFHRHSATLGSGSARKNELMGWSRGYMLAKYRMHRRPALFVRAALAELAIASAQLVLDRTAVGVLARVRGFRAGLRAPTEGLPDLPEVARRISLAEALRRRAARRRR